MAAVRNGWLSPYGELVVCDGQLHAPAAFMIADRRGIAACGDAERALESAGWVKLSYGQWMLRDQMCGITEAQERAVRGWYMQQDRKVPATLETSLSDRGWLV